MSASADDLIEELLSLLPAPLEALPATLSEVVEEAIQQARDGDLEFIEGLIQSMRELEATLRLGHDGPTHGLCNQAASQCLAEIDLSQQSEALTTEIERALELDPYAVEAMIMLGDLADSREQSVAWYQRASDAAQHRDPAAIKALMPRLRKHMGHSLVEAGSLSDAAQILLPALQENPADPDDCRYPLVDVCLRLGWHDELARIVSQFPHDPLGPVDFAAALLAFASQGDSPDARTLLVAAIGRHPGVADYLIGAKRMPRIGERISARVEQQVTAAEYLLPSLREIEGTLDWIRNVWTEVTEDKQADGDDAYEYENEDGRLSLAEADDAIALAADLQPQATDWYLLVEKNPVAGGYLVVVWNAEDADLLTVRTASNRPTRKVLKEIVLSAISEPVTGPARKPRTLRVATKADVKTLEPFCAKFDVAVVQEKLAATELKNMRPVFEMIARGLQADGDQEQDISMDAIERLPVCDEVWYYGLFQPPLWVSEGLVPTRPYLQLAYDAESGLIVHQALSSSRPGIDKIIENLCSTMAAPMCGEPRQVRAIVVDPGTIDGRMSVDEATVERLNQQFPNTQIMLGDEQTKYSFDGLIGEMLQMKSPVQTAIRDLPGMDDTRLAELYQILANFYRAKPWNMVGGDRLFEIHCKNWETPNWTACVMGQLGQEFGIALYDDPSDAARIMELSEPDSEPEFAEIDTLVAHFNEAFDVLATDFWHQERNHWAVAGREAYSLVARFTQGELRAATAEDIDVLMQILPHVPRFLDHPTNQPFSVGEGPQAVTFRWCS